MKVNVVLHTVPWKWQVSAVALLRSASPNLGLREAWNKVAPTLTTRYDVPTKKWVPRDTESSYFTLDTNGTLGQLFDRLREIGAWFELEAEGPNACRLVSYSCEEELV
jgi:hypothetical protein